MITKTSEEIITTLYQPTVFAVDGLLAQGLFILAGSTELSTELATHFGLALPSNMVSKKLMQHWQELGGYGVRFENKRSLAALDSAIQETDDPELKARLQSDFDRKSSTLKRQEARLAAWCEENDLYPQTDRTRVVGFGRSVSQKAVHGAKRYDTKTGEGIGRKKPKAPKKVKQIDTDEEIFGKTEKPIDKSVPDDIIDLDEHFPKIDGEHSAEVDIGPSNHPTCNPDYTIEPRARSNCGNCTVAYELRRRGYDVEAELADDMKLYEWKGLFSGSKTMYYYPSDDSEDVKTGLSSLLLKNGDEGARGAVFAKLKFSDEGHFFSWEIRNGEVIFRDPQSGMINAEYLLDNLDPLSIQAARWDNLEPRDTVLKSCKRRADK